MPRLPTIDDLGARPVPVSRRGVASDPAAGVVGAAVSDIGNTLTGIAKQKFEQEDRVAFAAAKSAVLSADTAARAELEDDPDYSTAEKRYLEKMTAARTAAAGMLTSKADRALFEADAKADVERGRAQVMKGARDKQVVARKAVVLQSLDNLSDTARRAADEPTRAAAIGTVRELIDGAKKEGIVDPLEAQELSTKWAGGIATQWATGYLNREDPVGAAKVLDQYGDMIDWKTRDALEARIKGVLDTREAVAGVGAVMGTPSNAEGSTVVIGDPLRGKGKGPVPGGQYGAGRDYGSHHGVDFPAPKGTAVFSTGIGTAKVSKSEKGGNIVSVEQPDGTTWKFMHLGDVKVKDGDRVTPDTVIGTVGMTGRSTGPHLHTEVWKDGKAVDPQKVIGSAQQAPQRHDLNAIYAQIDGLAAEDAAAGSPWTTEKVERWKQEADRQVSRNEQLANRQDDAAMRSALDVVDKLGDNFTDTSKIPNYQSLSPRDRIQLDNMADANRKAQLAGQGIKADGEVAITMNVLAARDPDAFMTMDLRTVRPFMKPAEFESLAVAQAKMIRDKQDNPAPTASLRTEVDGAITYYNKISGAKAFDFKEQTDRARYMRMTVLMRDYVNAATQGKRAPTDDEYKAAYDSATMKVWTNNQSVPRYQAQPGQAIGVQIPGDVRARIVTALRSRGNTNPSEDEVGRYYLLGKGRPGFWR